MADNTTTKNYADGTPLFESDLDDLYQDLQVSKSNLAFSTTGSSSGEVLQSTGSNLEPSWVTADTVASNITATGANAIFSDVTSCNASTANLIGINMGASGANVVLGAVSSCQASIANLIGNNMGASGANHVLEVFTRASVATTVGLLGIGYSALSGSFSTTNSSFTDVTNLTVGITVSGRPVRIELESASSAAGLVQISDPSSRPELELQFLRGTSTIGIHALEAQDSTGGSSTIRIAVPPSSFRSLDTGASSGTYTYKVQARVNNGSAVVIENTRLIVYEI